MGSLIIKRDGKAPSHITNTSGLGNQNVSASDFEVPRIKLLQKLSGECDRIKGASAGKLFNTVSEEVSSTVLCLNLRFRSGYAALTKDKNLTYTNMAGTYVFEDEDSASQSLVNEDIDPGLYNFHVIHIHDLLLLDEKTGKIESPAFAEFIKTKVKVSKGWNTKIGREGGDRFSHVWEISSEEINHNGNKWFNFVIEPYGYASDELYAEAKTVYDSMTNGSVKRLADDLDEEKALAKEEETS